MTVTQEEWEDLLSKHGKKCFCCGREDLPLTKDHVIPISQNGEDIIDNIQPLCGPCNSKKGDRVKDYRGSLKYQGQRKSPNYWYSINHAANLLDKSPSTIKYWIRKDLIPHIMSEDGKKYVWVSDEDKSLRNEIATMSKKIDDLLILMKSKP